MTPEEFNARCKELCDACRHDSPVRLRHDTKEWVHDSWFGPVDPTTGRKAGFAHRICSAHDFRVANG